MPKRSEAAKNWYAAGCWMLVVLVVLLLPAPREWGAFGDWVSPHYDRVRAIIQPVAHFVLMGILAMLLMRCFANRRIQHAVLFSVALSVGLAMLFEVLQFLLPSNFGRACDMFDVACALAGAGLGCAFSLHRAAVRKK